MPYCAFELPLKESAPPGVLSTLLQLLLLLLEIHICAYIWCGFGNSQKSKEIHCLKVHSIFYSVEK